MFCASQLISERTFLFPLTLEVVKLMCGSTSENALRLPRYFSGDIPPHNAWLQSHEYNVRRLRATAALIRQAFPDTPVVYSVGNHEAAPVNR